MTTEHPRALPIAHVARALRVPVAWLRAEAEAGRIPYLRAGRAMLCDLATVQRILWERARQGDTDADARA